MTESNDMLYFLESCKSEATRKSYEFQIEKFLKWSGKDFESIKFLPKIEVTNLLCDYALYLKKRISANSLLNYFAGIFKLFKIAEIDFNRAKVVGIFPSKVSLRGYRAITDQEWFGLLERSQAYSVETIEEMLERKFWLKNRLEEEYRLANASDTTKTDTTLDGELFSAPS